MFKRLMISAFAFALCVPTMASGQQAHREGGWELNLGAGYLFVDSSLRDFLGSGAAGTRFADSATPSSGIPMAFARVGYIFDNHLGLSVSGEAASGEGLRFYTPTAALTYNINLNGSTSPFFLVGAELTRIEGENDRVTHSTWGALAGLGIRQMLGESVALRLEGRVRIEGYDEVPMSKETTYSPVVTLGLSYFTGGERAAPAVRAAACPSCPPPTRTVDTVRVMVPAVSPPPPVIVIRDTLVLDGVNFAFDESVLTPESQVVLDRVARALLEPQWADVRFEVAGHTSEIGTAAYNMTLSERRAEAVRAYLVSRGVQDGRMTARGYGETQPLFPNDREGRAWQNRRVELRRIP